MAYVAPTKGQVRGSSKFGAGFGARNGNPFNINEAGAGLWAAGYDPSDPDILSKVTAYGAANPGAAASIRKQQAKTGQDLTAATDWFFRDQARAQDKDNSFLNSTLGKILVAGAQVALGAIPGIGPALSAGLGAGVGFSQGGVVQGLLGAATGYGAGSFGSSLATKGLSGTVSSAVDGVKNFFGGGAVTNVNQFLPADIAARAGTAVAGAGGSSLAGIGKTLATGARVAGAASSVADFAKSALGVGVPVAAGLALAGGLRSPGTTGAPGAVSNLGGAADVQGSVPAAVGDPREAERKRAAAAYGASDTIATSSLGVKGEARTKRKQVLGA